MSSDVISKTKPTDVRPNNLNRRNILLGGTDDCRGIDDRQRADDRCTGAAARPAPAPTGQRPNILVIFGDDIGIANISAYSNGLMGYATPNIDRIGREGVMFLHYYGEQSCTAGRSAFLTGQHIIRTGPEQGRLPRRADGHEPARSVDRRAAQEPRLCHRPIRQEPRRRPQRVAADGERLR